MRQLKQLLFPSGQWKTLLKWLLKTHNLYIAKSWNFRPFLKIRGGGGPTISGHPQSPSPILPYAPGSFPTLLQPVSNLPPQVHSLAPLEQRLLRLVFRKLSHESSNLRTRICCFYPQSSEGLAAIWVYGQQESFFGVINKLIVANQSM
jgi:hypothetical protein